MKLITVLKNGHSEAAIRVGEGLFTVGNLNRRFGVDWPVTVDAMLEAEAIPEFAEWAKDQSEIGDPDIPGDNQALGPLFQPQGKLWGIGLNYREHAGDLDESVPEGLPGSFIKPTTTVIGPGEAIRIPKMSERTTAEAEIAIVIGRECRNVPKERWLDVVAGFVAVIDMTAEDILRQNPRFLTLSKSFETFLVLGSELLTPDEIDDVLQVRVTTVHNGNDHATNLVANMTYPPDYLVALHSEVMTLQPGDIISTGTPGAVPIAHGDTVTCRIDGFLPLSNPVIDDKVDV